MFLVLLVLKLIVSITSASPTVDEIRKEICDINLRRMQGARKGYLNYWQSITNEEEDDDYEYPTCDINNLPSWIPVDDKEVKEMRSKLKIPIHLNDQEERAKLGSSLDNMFNKFIEGKVCPYSERNNKDCAATMQAEEIRVATPSRNADELLHYWTAWRNATGKKIRDDFVTYYPIENKIAVLNGYADYGSMWRKKYYGMENFKDEVLRLWNQVFPLYKELHAYIRRKLIEKYGPDKIKSDGPIPAHLLSNTMDEMWVNIDEFTRPYPQEPTLDIAKAMKNKGMIPIDMVNKADDFYASIGMDKMTSTYMEKSIWEKPTDRDFDCYPLSIDFVKKGDYRTRFCASLTTEDFFVIFHEMGHVQYFMEYSQQPFMFMDSPNSGFHEAIGETVALSAFRPEYLGKIGLLDEVVNHEEQQKNFLYRMALMRLGSLSHFLVVDLWRWDVFDGTISKDELNEKWWEYRLKYQGHCPPVKRTEGDFDPGAVYLIARDVPFIRYFVANIIEFQFHKALCEAKGHQGPLHKCSIHNSTEAGDHLKSMLKLGSTKSWPEAMEVITGGKTNKMDTGPLLEYFSPLYEWLKEQNTNHDLGWNSNDPTVCP